MIKTELNFKEKIFSIISYIPKATVQASIGGVALSRGLKCGDLVLSVSIIAIILTAPIGAILIDILGFKLLEKGNEDINSEIKENSKENVFKTEENKSIKE